MTAVAVIRPLRSLALAAAWPALALAQARPPAGTAALAGVVRDTLGDPLTAVEIVVVGRSLGTRTDSLGRFALEGVPAGTHVVRFRRLGYAGVEVDWAAETGQRVELSVRLDPLPQYLDPVVTHAREGQAVAGTSSVTGVVVDSLGVPVPAAVVQLVGVGRTTLTADEGSFVFRRLAPGDYTVLVRRIGFVPATLHLRIADEDARALTLRLHRLPASLDTVKVAERSGYGRLEAVYKELEARQRWRSPLAVQIVGEDLRTLGRQTLDMVLAFKGGPAGAGPVPLISRDLWRRESGAGAAGSGSPGMPLPPTLRRLEQVNFDQEQCVLLNGRSPRRMNLRFFGADQLDRVEIYPAGTELTGSVGARFGAYAGCEQRGPRDHPTYLVLWVKGSEREP